MEEFSVGAWWDVISHRVKNLIGQLKWPPNGQTLLCATKLVALAINWVA